MNCHTLEIEAWAEGKWVPVVKHDCSAETIPLALFVQYLKPELPIGYTVDASARHGVGRVRVFELKDENK